MVRDAGVPFRTAHQVVGALVRRAIEEGLRLSEVPLETIQEISAEVAGRQLDLTEEAVRQATDPRTNVERRKSTGGPAPVEVGRMIEDRKVALEDCRERQAARLRKIEEAKTRLEEAMDALTA